MNDKEKQIMESFNKYQAVPEILKLYNRLDLALGEYIGAAIKDAYYSGYRTGLEQKE